MNVQISIGFGLSHLGFLDLKQCWLFWALPMVQITWFNMNGESTKAIVIPINSYDLKPHCCVHITPYCLSVNRDFKKGT